MQNKTLKKYIRKLNDELDFMHEQDSWNAEMHHREREIMRELEDLLKAQIAYDILYNNLNH